MCAINGLYAAYFSGHLGNTVVLFLLRNGHINGVDGTGTYYRGAYKVDESGTVYDGSLETNFVESDEPKVALVVSEARLNLPHNFHNSELHLLQTPVGEVSFSFRLVERL